MVISETVKALLLVVTRRHYGELNLCDIDRMHSVTRYRNSVLLEIAGREQ